MIRRISFAAPLVRLSESEFTITPANPRVTGSQRARSSAR